MVTCPSCGLKVSSPKIHSLRGEEAIKALNDYMDELEKSNPEELTEAQARVVVKLAEVLISVIGEETTILDSVKQSDLLQKLKTIITSIPQRHA